MNSAYGRGGRKPTIHLEDKEFKYFSACGHSLASVVDTKHVFLIDCKKCLKKIAKEQGK